MFDRKLFPKGGLHIIEVLNSVKHKAYFVGGCVRDLLLGIAPKEWDITTDAAPAVTGRLFDKVVPTGIDFGTVTVVLDDGSYEVTTFRSDESYSDGRHPDSVRFTGSLAEDLSRRDFTVNAMAFDPLSGEFVDMAGGREDIKKRLIRAVGEPAKRFMEDGLRPVRACRFAAQLGFKIDEATLGAIPAAAAKVGMVAPERFHDELVKMLLSPKPSVGIEYMRLAGILKLVLPELEGCFGVEQPKQFHKYDVYWHSLHSCDELPGGNYRLRLAGLLHDVAKPACKETRPEHRSGMTFYDHDEKGAEMARAAMERLRFSNSDTEYVLNLIKNHMFNYTSDWSDSAVRRFMIRVGTGNLDDLFALREADLRAMDREVVQSNLEELKGRIRKVIEDDNALSVKALKVDGKDVMKSLGVQQGPRVGEVLGALLERVIEDPSQNDREKLLKIIRSMGKVST